MDNWSATTVRKLLDGRSTAARIRFLGSFKQGRIDFYFRGSVPGVIRELIAVGWRYVETLQDLPKDVNGHVYRHTDINADRRRRSRALLLRCMERRIPTTALPEQLAIEETRTAAPFPALPAPSDYSRYRHHACASIASPW